MDSSASPGTDNVSSSQIGGGAVHVGSGSHAGNGITTAATRSASKPSSFFTKFSDRVKIFFKRMSGGSKSSKGTAVAPPQSKGVGEEGPVAKAETGDKETIE